MPVKKIQKLKVAMIQLDVGPDWADNLARAKALADVATERGAQVLCLPELFSYMGSFKNPTQVANDLAGLSIEMLREIASRHNIYVVGGSILTPAKRGLPKNTCLFIGPDGKIISRYSKMHLFDIEVPGKIRFFESRIMQPGGHTTVADTPYGRFGFAICNDLRYPELFRRIAMAGARVIFLVAAFTKFTGRDHWLALNRVRAIENQCYIVAINQSGKNVDGVRFFGSSLVVDPWGKVLKEGPGKGDALIICTIDLSIVDKIRRQLPALKKIRPYYPIQKY